MWQQTLESQIGQLPIVQNQTIAFILDFPQSLHKTFDRFIIALFQSDQIGNLLLMDSRKEILVELLLQIGSSDH